MMCVGGFNPLQLSGLGLMGKATKAVGGGPAVATALGGLSALRMSGAGKRKTQGDSTPANSAVGAVGANFGS